MRRSVNPQVALLALAMVSSLVACKKREADSPTLTKNVQDTGFFLDTGEAAPEEARWTIMVFMNGDNDLEDWVLKDLNELETEGSGAGVQVVVQADRAEGYSQADGDWKTARRYYIVQDQDDLQVSSPVLQELGEVDMGSSDTLSEFLLWGAEHYPAEHYALVMWDHGDGWSVQAAGGAAPPPYISDDSDSRNMLSIAEGDLREGLAPFVEANGLLDIIAFDACSMAAWEVAHSLRDQALYMAASETSVGMQGYGYGGILAVAKASDEVTAEQVALEFARGSVEDGGEWTHVVVDLAQVDGLATAIDALAGLVLDDSSLQVPLLMARDQARGTDVIWKNYYLDLSDLASLLAAGADPSLAAAGEDILAAMDVAVIANYRNTPFEWVGGLNIFFDTTLPDYARLYSEGQGATWAAATRWDELILELTTR